jgi:hypothetical protein
MFSKDNDCLDRLKVNDTGLKVFLTALTLLIFFCAFYLVLQTLNIYLIDLNFSSFLFELSALFVVSAVLLLLVTIKINSFSSHLVTGIAWLIQTHSWFILVIGLIAVTALMYQVEEWLLSDSHLLSTLMVIVTLLTISFFLSVILKNIKTEDLKSFIAKDTIKHLLHGKNNLLLSVSTICLGLILLTRTVFVGSFATYIPLMCDEASTFWLFGQSPIVAITRFYTPNNHILNSLLVWFGTTLFSSEEIYVRLFSVIASALSVVFCYLLAQKWFNSTTALITAAFAGASFWMLHYAFQARGYVFISLLSPLAALAIFQTFQEGKQKLGWTLYLVSIGISFGMLPTTLYYWISLLAFCLLIYFFHKKIQLQLPVHWLKNFFVYQALILILIGLIYINPVLYLFRTGSLNAGFFSFPEIQPNSFPDLARDFFRFSLIGGSDVSVAELSVTGLLTITGLFAGLFGLVYSRNLKIILLLLCLFMIPFSLLIFASPLPFPRNFYYLLPFLLIVCAYGWFLILTSAVDLFSRTLKTDRLKLSNYLFIQITALILFFVMFSDTSVKLTRSMYSYHNQSLPAVEIAKYLENHVGSSDAIVASSCLDYMVSYYIAPNYHVTSVLEWWNTGTPYGEKVFVLSSQTADKQSNRIQADVFVVNACQGYSEMNIAAQIGEKYIYVCENH